MRFCELLPEVKEFLRQSKDAVFAQLDDQQWLRDLAFLADLTGILNELSLELQGKNKIDMISALITLKCELQLLSTKLQRQDLH